MAAEPPQELTSAAEGIGDAGIAERLRPDLQVIRPLGDGSTSRVYLARDVSIRRLVAVKVLRKELALHPGTRTRFVREAQSAARVRHPNVISIYRISELADGAPFIVMEYIDGRTVQDVVDTAGLLGLEKALGLLASIASAIATIHNAGVVHRDLQPGNIYIENLTGRVVLGDFTIARLLDSGSTSASRLTQVGIRLGNTRYMSPEQLRDEEATTYSDVYAFGVLAYELLAGRGPFDAESEAQILLAHLRDSPLPLSTLRGDLDPNVAKLLENCLAKEPRRRPLAADLATDLQRYAGRATEPEVQRGPLAEFFEELQRRHVYKVLVGYGAVSAAVFGTAQVVYDAFEYSKESYQLLVLLTLAGFPVAMVLSWLYDFTSSGIERTRSSDRSKHIRILKWLGLAISIATAAGLAWILLYGV